MPFDPARPGRHSADRNVFLQRQARDFVRHLPIQIPHFYVPGKELLRHDVRIRPMFPFDEHVSAIRSWIDNRKDSRRADSRHLPGLDIHQRQL